jgi:tetratricopeptide (TPR) repeat protein
MEVDIATPPVEAEGKSKVWIKDDEEFRYWPFARWANADVQGSPKLTRLFADLTLETKGLPDDIESLALPAPSIEPTTPAAREYIDCSELTKVLSEGDCSSLSWGDGFCFSDSEAGLVVVPAPSRPPPNPFKFTNSDVLFPAQIWISQPPPSPFDELYVFPTQILRHTNRRQKFETILHSQRKDELLFAGKLEQLKRAGFDEWHPAVFELTKRLAQTFYAQGKVKQAETLLRKLLSVQQDMDRIQSMDVLYLQIDLIDSLCHRGRVFEAKKLHEKVHAAIVKTFPTQHHLLQRSLVSMIIILDQMKENGEQETMSRQLVQINLAQLGPKHPDTIDAMSRLAISMRLRRRYIESEKLQRIAVKLSYEVHTEDYDVICWSFIDLARGFEDQAYFEDAIKYYLLAAERAREFLGDEHTTTMACNRSIGRTLRRKGVIRESEELLFATTKLQTKALGEDHVETLWTMFELGCTLCESDKDQEGAGALWLEKCFQKGLDIFEPKHSLTIYSCDSLGICYERQGRYDDALALYHKLLNNVRDAEGAEDPTISKIQGWIDKVHEFIEEERG